MFIRWSVSIYIICSSITRYTGSPGVKGRSASPSVVDGEWVGGVRIKNEGEMDGRCVGFHSIYEVC